MTHVFFDFETTGIGKFTQQRAIQLCWIVTDLDCKILHTYSYYIKGNTELNTEFHKHLTLDLLEKEGRELKWVISRFLTNIKQITTGKLVAHNISFDLRILDNEIKRCAIDFDIYSLEKIFFCTMKRSTNLTKIKRSHAGGYKYPKLCELYEYFYGKQPELQLHDAKNDTIVLVDCYRKLMEYNTQQENSRKRRLDNDDNSEAKRQKKNLDKLRNDIRSIIRNPSHSFRIEAVTGLQLGLSRNEVLRILDNIKSRVEKLPQETIL